MAHLDHQWGFPIFFQVDTCLCIAFEEHYLKLAHMSFTWSRFLLLDYFASGWQYEVLIAENFCLKKYIFYHILPTVVDDSMLAPLNSSLKGLIYTLKWQKRTMLLHDTNVKVSTVTCTKVSYSIFLFDKFTLPKTF